MAIPKASRTAQSPHKKLLRNLLIGLALILAVLYWWQLGRYRTVQVQAESNGELLAKGGFAANLRRGTILRTTGWQMGEVWKLDSGEVYLKTFAANITLHMASLKLRVAPGTELLVLRTPDSIRVVAPKDTLTIFQDQSWFSAGTRHTLFPGQGLVLNLATDAVTTRPAADPNLWAWASGRLSFRQLPLAEVFRQLSGYFNKSFRLASPDLAQLTYSGAFINPSPAEVLDLICAIHPLRYSKKPDGSYLLEVLPPKPSPESSPAPLEEVVE